MFIIIYLLFNNIDIITTGRCTYKGHNLNIPLDVENGDVSVLRCPLANNSRSKFRNNYYTINWMKYDDKTIDWRTYKNKNSNYIIRNYFIDINNTHRIDTYKSTLWFTNAYVNDSGIYICKLSNETYCEYSSLNFNVYSTEQINNENILSRDNVLSVEGTDKILYCLGLYEFLESPEILNGIYKLTWLKDNTEIDNNNHFVINDNVIELYIKNVTILDSGKYTCILKVNKSDIVYNVTRYYNLKVIGKTIKDNDFIKIVYPHNNSTISTKINDTLKIDCVVIMKNDYYDSPTTVSWYVNNNYLFVYENSNRIIETIETSNENRNITASLYFKKVTYKDLNAEFQCVVIDKSFSYTVKYMSIIHLQE
nr:interleukin-1 receptor type 2-like protein [Wadden Sea poxvirus]